MKVEMWPIEKIKPYARNPRVPNGAVTNEITVWDCDRAPANKYHPTQKPVALAERAMINSSTGRAVVLDLFLGSGSTVIAAERLGRRCFGMEISPAYCDVVVKRWENFTGKKAERKANGQE